MNKKQLKQIKDHELKKEKEDKILKMKEKEDLRIDEYLHDKFCEKYGRKYLIMGIILMLLAGWFIFFTEFWGDGLLRFLVTTMCFMIITIYIKEKIIKRLRIKLGFAKEQNGVKDE